MTYIICDNGVNREATPDEAQQFEADKQANLVRRQVIARLQRDQLLAATDWTQAKDIPDAVSSKYAAYRQALRDVPQQSGFPQNIVWPVKPE